MFRKLFAGLGKPEPRPDLAALQDAVVGSVVECRTDLQDGEWEGREWVYLAVNHEVSPEDGLRTSTQATVLAQRQGDDVEGLNFRLGPGAKAAILALRDAMTKTGEPAWTILDLSVERDGRYDFSFSYSTPPRLNGDLLHRPLKNLKERYLRDKA